MLKEGWQPSGELANDIVEFCRGKIAGYKRPKSGDFITEEERPRTTAGKILHRVLRDCYSKWSEAA